MSSRWRSWRCHVTVELCIFFPGLLSDWIVALFPNLKEKARRVVLQFWQLNAPTAKAASAFSSDFLNKDCVVMLQDHLKQEVELVKMDELVMQEMCAILWLDEDIHTSIFALSDRLAEDPNQIDYWQQSVVH